MRHAAEEVIRDEHRALAAMLRSLGMMVAQSRRDGVLPRFDVLRAMLLYIDEFPERLHHRKESELLFPLLRERAPGLSLVIDRLEREHADGAHLIRELEHALLEWEVLGEPRRAGFERLMDRYLGFYLQHMETEEREVLPAAHRHLEAEDWATLDAAFAANRDPLTGHEPAPDYRPLFSRILHDAPAPIGLGGKS